MYSRNPREGSDASSTCTVPDFFAENEACLPFLILNVFTAFDSSSSSLKVTLVVVIVVKEEDVDVSPLLFRSIVATASSSSSLSKDDDDEDDDTVEKNRVDFLFVEVLRRTRKEHDAAEVVVVHDVVLILCARILLSLFLSLSESKTNRVSFPQTRKERTQLFFVLLLLSVRSEPITLTLA